MKLLIFAYCLAVLFIIFFVKPSNALPATAFYCLSERAANAIGEKLAIGQMEADEVAMPLLNQGVCRYLPAEIEIRIVYRGKVFQNKVQVVGFKEGGAMRYGLMPYEIQPEGSI